MPERFTTQVTSFDLAGTCPPATVQHRIPRRAKAGRVISPVNFGTFVGFLLPTAALKPLPWISGSSEVRHRKFPRGWSTLVAYHVVELNLHVTKIAYICHSPPWEIHQVPCTQIASRSTIS